MNCGQAVESKLSGCCTASVTKLQITTHAEFHSATCMMTLLIRFTNKQRDSAKKLNNTNHCQGMFAQGGRYIYDSELDERMDKHWSFRRPAMPHFVYEHLPPHAGVLDVSDHDVLQQYYLRSKLIAAMKNEMWNKILGSLPKFFPTFHTFSQQITFSSKSLAHISSSALQRCGRFSSF